MSKVLRIDSSLFGENGQSYSLTKSLSDALAAHYKTDVVHRDLIKENIPHFDASTIAAIGKGEAHLADELIAELQAAEHIVIAAPMYNFSIPSQLKSWLDHITRAQVTFRYTENGPEGLLKGKKVYVVVTSGGQHVNSSRDGISPYLKTILGFVGLGEQLEFIYVEGLSMSSHKEQAISEAKGKISHIVQEIQAA